MTKITARNAKGQMFFHYFAGNPSYKKMQAILAANAETATHEIQKWAGKKSEKNSVWFSADGTVRISND